jgi:phosphoglycolate phosphatase-like HAD superfamily hydrolase
MTPARSVCPALLAALAALVTSCDAPAVRHLDPQNAWYGDNRERIDAMLDDIGAAPAQRTVAVFDWDNTIIKNDVGDATMFWMLRNSKLLQPAEWAGTSRYLTPDAATALTTACAALAEPGQPLPTADAASAACTDEIVSVYYTGATLAGDDAFAGWNYRTMEPAYAWTVQLQAGHTLDELRGYADEAISEALAADEGAEQTVGTTAGLAGYLRVYAPMQDLIATLQANGVDVWVLSASSQPFVEAFADRVGIAADHVVGVRAIVDDAGKTTTKFQGCGAVADDDGALITYLEGKRCWMNKAIFSVSGGAAQAVQTDPALRPVFAAGDSDTDVSFLQDATGLRLVLNRNKKELMCNAYNDAGGTWLVNPMFIGPKPQLADGYACSQDACRTADGTKTACTDELGAEIPDQKDAVFCADDTYCTQ